MRLQFGDAYDLWESLLVFRRPSYGAWAARNPEEARLVGDLAAAPISHLGGDGGHNAPVLTDRLTKRGDAQSAALPSQDDLERMVQFQLEHLQTFGCRVPNEMQQRLRTMLDHLSEVPPDVHFVR